MEPRRTLFPFVIVVVVVAVVAAAIGYMLRECPEDKWPHQTYTSDGKLCAEALNDILVKAKAAWPSADATTKAKIESAMTLVLECAWQDLPGHDDIQMSAHALCIKRALVAAEASNWDDVVKWMTVGVVMPEGVEHPH